MTLNAQDAAPFERIEALVQQLETVADPQARAAATELVGLLMELHASGLGRLLERLQRSPAGGDVLAEILDDPQIARLLMLHELHPVDLEVRVRQGLRKAQPHLLAHGSSVELIGVTSGVVRLRVVEGSGASPSPGSLRSIIEQAVFEAAPDVTGLVVDGLPLPPPQIAGFVPLETLYRKPDVVG